MTGRSATGRQWTPPIGFIACAALAAAVDPSIALAGDAATFFIGAFVLSGEQVHHAPKGAQRPGRAIARPAVVDGLRTALGRSPTPSHLQ